MAGLALPASSALAADMAMPRFVLADSNTWIVTVTANAQATPTFPGSRNYTAFVYPSASVRRAGEPQRFSAPDDGISFTLFENPVFKIGPVARFNAGRYYGDDRRRLFGLNDVQWSVEPGIFFEVWPAEVLRARVELRHGVNGHHGFVGTLGLDYVQPVGAFTLSLGPRFHFGDGEYARKYFGVQPYEALLNGRVTPYTAGGGFNTAGVLGAATYTFSEQWAVTGYAGYNRLIGDAGRSPIVRNLGTPNQFTFGAKVSYSFSMPALF